MLLLRCELRHIKGRFGGRSGRKRDGTQHFTILTLAFDDDDGVADASLAGRSRSLCTAKQNGRRRKGAAVRYRILLQGEMGPRRRIPHALQEKPLSGAQERDGTRAHAESNHGNAEVSCNGRWAL